MNQIIAELGGVRSSSFLQKLPEYHRPAGSADRALLRSNPSAEPGLPAAGSAQAGERRAGPLQSGVASSFSGRSKAPGASPLFRKAKNLGGLRAEPPEDLFLSLADSLYTTVRSPTDSVEETKYHVPGIRCGIAL